jgi:hypothetical protein
MVNSYASFCTHFLNCLAESKRVSCKAHIHVSSKAKPLGFVLYTNFKINNVQRGI